MTAGRQVIYVSGTRADFGLMQSALHQIAAVPGLEIGVVVTGMHLDSAYGATATEVVAAGLPVVGQVPVEQGRPSGALMAKNIGTMIIGLVETFERLSPDIVLVLGDRGEMLAGAIAATHLSIPLVHIHGGERSGTIDEPVRHAISKLSHFHFVATQESRDRLVRMGEDASRIEIVGAPGLDGLCELARADKEALYAARRLNPRRPLVLVLFHPVLDEASAAGDQMRVVLEAALDSGAQVLALRPNSDAGSAAMGAELDRRAGASGDLTVVTHMPRGEFVSFLKYADVLLGNSSSGIIEAASFGTPVVNVGSRQNLRQRNRNVRDVDVEDEAIRAALRMALAGGRFPAENVYGDGHAGERIAARLASLDLTPSKLVKINAY